MSYPSDSDRVPAAQAKVALAIGSGALPGSAGMQCPFVAG